MAELMLVNPRRRKRRASVSKKKTTRRRRNPIAANPRRRTTTYRRRRRNPSPRMSMRGILNNQVMPAATAAVGAVGLDVAWGYLPVPDQIKAGPARHIAKGLGAIGLGMLAGMVVKKQTADQMALGALTVVMHGAMKEAVGRFAPNVQMGEYLNDGMGYWSSGIDPEDAGMGAYFPPPSPPQNIDEGMSAYDMEEFDYI